MHRTFEINEQIEVPGIFAIGESVLVRMRDGARFSGLLTDFSDDLIFINGLGFPRDDIKNLVHIDTW